MKKYLIKINVIILSLICVVLLTNVKATSDNVYNIDGGAYYETKVDQTNDVGYGLTHNRYLGYSQIQSKYAKSGVDTSFLPQRTNVLEIKQDENTKVVAWGTIENGQWKENTILEMAKSYEKLHPGWKVVACINGDFFDINKTKNCSFTPSGAMISDGDVIKSQCNGGWGMLGFYYSETKQLKYFANNNTFSSNPTLSIYDEDGNIIKEYTVNKVNTEPGENETSLYYGVWNSNHVVESKTVDRSDAYVVSNAILSLAAYEDAFYGKGVISQIGKANLGKNQFAIVTNNGEIKEYLKEGVTIRVQQEANGELGNADSAIGCKGILVQDGNPVYALDDYDNARYPRTIIGQKEDGTLMMAVIDGRQAIYDYYGVTGVEASAILKYYDFYDAYQLDGGGSTTMAVLIDGELKIVNSPSDSYGKEPRKDSNGLMVCTRVNEYEYDYDVYEDRIDINLITINELEKYKEVYIKLNGQMKKVVDKKVSFDNLKSDTIYKYSLYSKVDDEYVDLFTSGAVSTSKAKAQVSGVVYSTRKSTTSNFEKILTVNFSSSESLVDVKVIIDGVTYDTKNKVLTIDDNIDILNSNVEIKVIYNQEDGSGEKEEVIKIDNVKISSSYLFLDYQFNQFEKEIENVLKK